MPHDKDPGWYPDPKRPKPLDDVDSADADDAPKFRWWDGAHWTDAVSRTLWTPPPHYPQPIEIGPASSHPTASLSTFDGDGFWSTAEGEKRVLQDRDLTWRVRARFWEYDPDGRRRPLILAGTAVSAIVAIGLITLTAVAASRANDPAQGNLAAEPYPVQNEDPGAGEAGAPHGGDPTASPTAEPSWVPTARPRWTPSTSPRPRGPGDPPPTTDPTPPPGSPGPTTEPTRTSGPEPRPEPVPTRSRPPRPEPTREPSPTPPGTPSPTRTPTPPTTPTPTRTPAPEPEPTGPQEPVMPPEAMQMTPEGAEAGVRHQVALFDHGAKTGDYGPANKHTWDGCDFCNAWMSPGGLLNGKRVSVEAAVAEPPGIVEERITVSTTLQTGGTSESYRFEMDWEPDWTHWDVVSITSASEPYPVADPDPTATVLSGPAGDPITTSYASAIADDCAMVYTTCGRP